MVYFYMVILITILSDQGTKYLVRQQMDLGESIGIVDGIFHLTYVENPGAAFGLFANQTVFFIAFTTIIIGIMGYLVYKQKSKKSLLSLSMALVIGGALGNLIDRILKQTVTDMFDFRVWPVFNVADMAIVIGLMYLAYRLIFRGEEF